MKIVLSILVITLLASEAHAHARYTPIENPYPARDVVTAPPPVRSEPSPTYRVEQAGTNGFYRMAPIPVYREAAFRPARISMPQDVRMPRGFRVNMNPAGRRHP